MQLTRAEIRTRIPHSGSMCLLEGVRRWDQTTLDAYAISHRDPQNPLRGAERLHAVIGVEYAAQAMAVHGGLLASGGAQMGFLASVRDLRLFKERLDDLPEELEIHVERISGSLESFIYAFIVATRGEVALSGRIAVRLMGTA